MKKMKLLIVILLSFLALLLVLMTVCAFIKIDPPASVVTTVFRMSYQYMVKYLVIGLAGSLIVYYLFKVFKKELPSATGIIFTIIFSAILITGIVYQVRIITAKTQKSEIEYSSTYSPKGAFDSKTTDESLQSGIQQLLVTTPIDSPRSDICIVHLNYGGWKAQDIAMRNWLKDMCVSEGYSYVQFAGIGSDEGNIIQIVDDVNKGLQWLKEHYKYNKIFVAGGSAGGTIALLTAFSEGSTVYKSSAVSVESVIALYPITNLKNAYDYFVTNNPATNWLDNLGDKIYCSLYSGRTGSLAGETKELMLPVFGDYQSDESYYADVDISALVDDKDIPILLIQGELDSMVVVEDNRNFFEELKRNGKTVAYLELPGLDHAFDLMDGTIQNRRIEEEITNWLRCFAD